MVAREGGAPPMARGRWRKVVGLSAWSCVCGLLIVVTLGFACQFLVECPY